MEANYWNNQRQAKAAAAATRLHEWPDVADLLRVRAVPPQRSTGLSRPLSAQLCADIAIRLGPGVAVPQGDHLQSWNRHPTQIWQQALANMNQDTNFQPVAAKVHGLTVVVITGPLYTSGLLSDPGRLIRPLLWHANRQGYEPRWMTAPAATTVLLSSDNPRQLVRLAKALSPGLTHELPDNLFQLGRSWSVRAA